MHRYCRFAILLVLFVLLAGCASPYFPKHALMDPMLGSSVVNPKAYQEKEVTHVTMFYGVMNPAFFTEVITDHTEYRVIHITW